MEEEVIERAKFLYFYNGGYLTKEECVKQSIKDNGNRCIKGILRLYDTTFDEYVKDLVRKM